MRKNGRKDWEAVLATLSAAHKSLETASSALEIAHQAVAAQKDRSAEELDLLKDEVVDVDGRFEALRRALKTQAGPQPPTPPAPAAS
jgi:hypothetical protein